MPPTLWHIEQVDSPEVEWGMDGAGGIHGGASTMLGATLWQIVHSVSGRPLWVVGKGARPLLLWQNEHASRPVMECLI